MTKARDLANIISGGFTESDIPNLSASKITSGTFADARIADLAATKLTGTIDNARIALDAAEIPNISTDKLTSGTIATARLGSGTADANTFLRGDQTFAAAGGGITEADTWRLTTDFSGSASPIASNWERSDTAGQGYFGTGMTQSSGIFTFPSTGWWFITFQAGFKLADDTSKYNGGYIVGTTNNSTYANLAGSDSCIDNSGSTSYTATFCATLFDVTSTTNCKVRFDTSVQTSATNTCGTSTYDLTAAKFIRLGDT